MQDFQRDQKYACKTRTRDCLRGLPGRTVGTKLKDPAMTASWGPLAVSSAAPGCFEMGGMVGGTVAGAQGEKVSGSTWMMSRRQGCV